MDNKEIFIELLRSTNREEVEGLRDGLEKESVIIASLLHDVCHGNIYFRSVKKKKTTIGTWEDCEGYKVSYKNFPMGICYRLTL